MLLRGFAHRREKLHLLHSSQCVPLSFVHQHRRRCTYVNRGRVSSRTGAPTFSSTMSTPTADPIGFLNPNTYLNHLSPKEAFEYETARNVLLILLGVWSFCLTSLNLSPSSLQATLLDILAYIPDDIRIAKRSRLLFVVICFIFSRYARQRSFLHQKLKYSMWNRLFAVAYVTINVVRRSVYRNKIPMND